MVAITSIRAIRRRLSYETWYGLHLYAYLGIALAFSHQIAIGADFIGDPVALWFWIGLYVVTFGLLIWYRVLTPIRVSARHRLRVAAVVPEAPERRLHLPHRPRPGPSCPCTPASSSTSASCAVAAGGARTRSPSRPRPTASTCA